MPEVIRGDQSWAFFSCFSCYSIFVSLMHDYLCSVGLGPRFIVYFVVISAGFWFLFSQYWPWDCLGRASPKWPNVLLNSTETWKFHGSAWNFVAWGKLWVLVINQTSSTTCYWLQNHRVSPPLGEYQIGCSVTEEVACEKCAVSLFTAVVLQPRVESLIWACYI